MNVKTSFGDLVGATARMAVDSATAAASNLIVPEPVSALVSLNASLLEQAAVPSRTSFFPTGDLSDATHSQAFDPLTAFYNPSKLVQLANGTWLSTQGRSTLLTSVLLPKAFWANVHFPAYGQSRYFRFVRTGYRIRVLVNAAVGCAGCMLVVYVPWNFRYTRYGFDSLLLCPHAFVNLSENSEVELVLPYINFRNYAGTDTTEGGTVYTFVWSPAQFPAGATQQANYAIFGSLISCDFQGPRPQGPIRQRVDIAEGPGSLLLANHQATDSAIKLSLAMEETMVDMGTSGMVKPVTSLKEILGVAMPMGLFTWGSTQAAGTAIYQDNMWIGQGGWLMNFLSEHFAYYRGSLKFLVTVFVSAFNRGRLRVSWYPATGDVYNYDNSNNALYSVLDLGVNSSVVLQVPYSWDVWRRSTSTVVQIGRLAIWVTNPLAANVTAPSTVNGLLMVAAGEDGEFTVPLARPVVYQMDKEDLLSTTNSRLGPSAAASAGLTTISGVGGDPTTDLPESTALNVQVVDVPIESVSHMNLSTYLGRASPLGTYQVDRTIQVVPINCPAQGTASIMKLFAYFSGPFSMHFYNKSDGHLSVAHTYASQSIPTVKTAGWFASLGMVVVPPGECMSVEIPFYSETSLRCISNDIETTYGPTFGSMVFQSEATTGSMVVWVSFGQIQLFTPIGVPLPATVSSLSGLRFPPEPLVLDALEYSVDSGEDDIRFPPDKESHQYERYRRLYPQGESNELEHCYVRDLTREGVEENPGPEMNVVFKSRGLYRHYGLLYDGVVYELDSENIVSSSLTGEVSVFAKPLTEDWVITPAVDVTDEIVEEILGSVGSKVRFMSDENCESYVRKYARVQGISQAKALSVFGMILVTIGMMSIASPQVSMEDIKSAIRTSADKAQATAMSTLASVYAQFTKLTTMQIVDSVSDEIVKKMCEMLVRVVCYGILYCSCPNFLTTMAFGGVIMMDLRSCEGLGPSLKALLEAMLAGDIGAMAEAFSDVVASDCATRRALLRESLTTFRKELRDEVLRGTVNGIPEPEIAPQSLTDGLRDFNVGSMAGKNVEWWLSRVARFCVWVKSVLDPNESDHARTWLKGHGDEVMGMMATADAVLSKSSDIDALRNPVYQKSVEDVRGRIGVVVRLMELARSPDVGPVRQLFRALCMVKKPQPVTDEYARIEPVGIWIQGGVGVGKSFLGMGLMDAITKEIQTRALKDPEGWEEDEINGYVYNHPGASEYMDLYKREFYHVIDDFGSTRQENDILHMAQICSTNAWQVPMAELSEKGAFYNSKVLIASTNRCDFSSTVLVDPEALRRRFPIQIVNVKPTEDYCRTATYGGHSLFDLGNSPHVLFDAALGTKLRADGTAAYQTGECWTCGAFPKATRVNVQDIARDVVDMIVTRKNVLKILKSKQRVREPEQLKLPDYTEQARALCNPLMVNVTEVMSSEASDVSKMVDEVRKKEGPSLMERISKLKHRKKDSEPQGLEMIDDACDAVSGDLMLLKSEYAAIGVDMSSKVDDLLSRIGGLVDSPFESFRKCCKIEVSPTERIKKWWSGVVSRMCNVFEKFLPYLKIAAVVTTLASAVATIAMCASSTMRAKYIDYWTGVRDGEAGEVKSSDEKLEEKVAVVDKQRPYAPPVKVRNLLKTAVDVPFSQMGVNPSAWSHISRLSGYFESKGVKYYFLGLHDHTLVTFKHALPMLETSSEFSVWYNGVRSERATIGRVVIPRVTGCDGDVDMDICLIEIPDLSFCFRDARKYVSRPVPNSNGVLTYADGQHYQSVHVADVQLLDVFVSHYPDGYRSSGLSISYVGHNAKGMCGALVLQMVGGAYKIVGIHFCGDSNFMGYGVRLMSFLDSVYPRTQGVVETKEVRGRKAFVPSHTKLHRSPLYGMVEPTKAPAVLHPSDPRLELEVDNLIKSCADKYRNNVFEVDALVFENAVTAVTRRVYSVTGHCDCLDMDEALSGVGGLNPLDLTTSPGLKYVERGKMTKRDLISFENGKYVACDELRSDVESTLQALSSGEMESIQFQTALKDELLPLRKVKEGNTRTIEVCAVDYTIAYRMIMGRIYSNIYSSFCLQTGIAVGINPYLDFHGLYYGLRGEWYALDYKKFDGSLPEGVMRAAVRVLASLHENPGLVESVHEPMVVSRQVVMDEVWTVRGGMPSGSPGTSVVNSVANLIMITHVMSLLGVGPEDLSLVVYGDDVLFATPKEFDSSRVIDLLFECFGMVATSVDKKSKEVKVTRETATFLKRSFVKFPDTNHYVGALDRETILQNPQWTRGPREFNQQVEAMLFEAVLHGKDFYEGFAQRARSRLKDLRFFVPSFEAKKREVYALIFM